MVPFNLKGIGITPCHKHKHQHQHQHFVSDALLTHILHSSYWPILKHSIFQSLWPFSFIIRSVLSQLDDFMTWEIFLFTIFFTAKNLKNIWTKISIRPHTKTPFWNYCKYLSLIYDPRFQNLYLSSFDKFLFLVEGCKINF